MISRSGRQAPAIGVQEGCSTRFITSTSPLADREGQGGIMQYSRKQKMRSGRARTLDRCSRWPELSKPGQRETTL